MKLTDEGGKPHTVTQVSRGLGLGLGSGVCGVEVC